MQIFVILFFSLFSVAALAETVVIEASQDNTLYQSSQGSISNGSGSFLFVGRNSRSEIRRAVVAFKDLSAIPSGATINSVKFLIYLNKQNAPATTLTIARLTADWGEGASDAAAQEGQGTSAATGDATWVHRFFDNTPWNSPGGDFNPTATAQIPVNMPGLYTFESSAAMIADLEDWLANPAGNFGWILTGGESSKSARRYTSREGDNEGRRPRLMVDYTIETEPEPEPGPVPGSDFSGPWFDPSSDGEGYLVFQTPAGWLIYYFGYSADGDRLWLVSNLVVIEPLEFGKDYEFTMLVGEPGTFTMPTPSDQLQTWGTLKIRLNDCVSGVFMLDGADGMKTHNTTKLIGIDGTSCSAE